MKQEPFALSSPSFSFILPSHHPPLPITSILSSMPRSDLVILQTQASDQKLRSLPLSPFPVPIGTPVLTHLFGSPEIPKVSHSKSRTITARQPTSDNVEEPVLWIRGSEDVRAWRRWGRGEMLGYRSYTGLEVEVSAAFSRMVQANPQNVRPEHIKHFHIFSRPSYQPKDHQVVR